MKNGGDFRFQNNIYVKPKFTLRLTYQLKPEIQT